MDSLYGGRIGTPFIIKQRFNSIDEMKTEFAKGHSYTDVFYGEYCIIENAEEAYDSDNGSVYCRGYSGAKYIGKIRGAHGNTIEKIWIAEIDKNIAKSLELIEDTENYKKDVQVFACSIINPNRNEEDSDYRRTEYFAIYDVVTNIGPKEMTVEDKTGVYLAVSYTSSKDQAIEKYNSIQDISIDSTSQEIVITYGELSDAYNKFFDEKGNPNGKQRIPFSVVKGFASARVIEVDGIDKINSILTDKDNSYNIDKQSMVYFNVVKDGEIVQTIGYAYDSNAVDENGNVTGAWKPLQTDLLSGYAKTADIEKYLNDNYYTKSYINGNYYSTNQTLKTEEIKNYVYDSIVKIEPSAIKPQENTLVQYFKTICPRSNIVFEER